MKRLGKQTVKMQNNVYITNTSSVVGKKEGEGPLSQYFDYILEDEYWGEKTFEKTESKDPYEFYLSGSTSILEVTNPNAEGDRHLIIFRDSFGSSITPLLLGAYAKVTIVDTRYVYPDFHLLDNQDLL